MILGVALAALLILSASARAASEYEPNDSRETAYGPLAGGTWYTAGTETVNDPDWYLFYVKTYSQVEFSATTAAKDSYSTYFELYDRDGEEVDPCCEGLEAYNEVTDRYAVTLAPGRYYLKASGSNGGRYKFRIDPPTALTTSRECGEAIVAKDLVAPLLVDANEALAKKNGEVAVKALAVHEAKKEVRHASKKAVRLKAKVKKLRRKAKAQRRRGRPRWVRRRTSAKLRRTGAKLRGVRGDVSSAVDRLNYAQEARQPVWLEKQNLELVVGQHLQAIAAADGQIARFC